MTHEKIFGRSWCIQEMSMPETGRKRKRCGDDMRQVMGPDLWMTIVRVMVNLGLVESL